MGRTYGKPFYWNFCVTNLDGVTPPSGANSANAPGTSFSTPSSADTDGTVVNLLNGIASDVDDIVLNVGGISINAGIGSSLGDLVADAGAGVGNPGASWT